MISKKIVLIISLLSTSLVAAKYQYGELTFSKVSSKKGQMKLVSFTTDPGYPITVMGDIETSVKTVLSAYVRFYKEMNWKAEHGQDSTDILNRLGREGWKVIDVDRYKHTSSTSKDPTETVEYLLIKEL